MKVKIHFTILFLAINCYAYCLSHKTCISAKSHLLEINPEWQFHLKEYDFDLDFPINFKNDDERIEFHLNHVFAYLTHINKTREDRPMGEKKKKFMVELLSYASAKEFPKNNYHRHRKPYFVDEEDRYCAVAHLLRMDNQSAMIDKIRNEKNNHYIKEMKSPALLEWATKNGFTEDELALIQPGYPSWSLLWSSWGNGNGIEGRVNVMKSILQDELLILAGAFTSIDGVAANNVIAWNGTDWITLGEGVDGNINDIVETEDGSLYIVGEFQIDGIQSNVAFYEPNQETWISLVENMNGVVHCVEAWNDQLIIGGSFTQLNNMETSHLASYHIDNDNWSNSNDQGIGGAFSVDMEVRDLEIFEEELLVAGSFLTTGTLSTDQSINQDSCSYLSIWNGNNWVHNLQGEFSEIYHIDITQGLITLVGDPKNNKCVATWGTMGPEWYIHQDTLQWGEFQFDDESEFNGITDGFIFGDFAYINFTVTENYKSYNSQTGINSIDGSITAVADFQGERYLAGRFSQIEGYDFNGLVKTDGTLPSKEIDAPNLNVYSNFNSLYLKGDFEEAGSLQIVNEIGQVQQQYSFDQNRWPAQIDLSSLNDGLYFYQLQIGTHTESDRFVHFERE